MANYKDKYMKPIFRILTGQQRKRIAEAGPELLERVGIHLTEPEAQADVRAIYTYHASSRGWGDIGYCWLIDKFGNAYEGRRGRDGPGYDGPSGRELVSEDVVAGHATSYNHGSSGIAMLGTFEGLSPSSAALSSNKTTNSVGSLLVRTARQ